MTTEPTQHIGPTAEEIADFWKRLFRLTSADIATHLTGIWLQGQFTATSQTLDFEVSVDEEARGDG